MKNTTEKPRSANLPVYLRLEADLVGWLDREAKRQRRSRAYIVARACQLLQAVHLHFEKENDA